MGNMREISIEECMRVSGGEIVVKARPIIPISNNFTGNYGRLFKNSMLSAGIMDSYEDRAGKMSSNEDRYDPVRDGAPGVPVDEDGDGKFDVIVTTGAKSIGFFDIGGGYWGLVGGLTFGSDGTLGVFTGLGLPGLQLGTGNEVSGQLPTGWDSASPPTVVFRTGNVLSGSVPAEPLPAKEGHYFYKGWGPFGFGQGYYPIPSKP